MSTRVLLLTSVLVGSALSAQGSYTTFGAGCGSSVCESANPNTTSVASGHNTNIFALGVPASASLRVVLGFELFTQARNTNSVTIATQIYAANAAGAPTGNPIATGSMTIGSTQGWYKTTFAAPLIVQANQKIFLSYTSTTNMYFPFASSGTRVSHFWHPPSATTWNGTAPNGFITQNWAWKLNCAGGGTPLTLSNTGVPTLGNSFSVDLSGAPANAAGIFAFGLSRTVWNSIPLPLDLGPMGATGCNLYVSLELQFSITTDAQGNYSTKLAVPNNAALRGIQFHNQYAVGDPTANGFGVTFSNGGTGKIG